ncbi:MAG TPA: CocE/NonD family hydrolase, partial [Pseudomonadota bacterium]|nr:CocE/NonD family hydrolase [Pseudomonadota bacterium]
MRRNLSQVSCALGAFVLWLSGMAMAAERAPRPKYPNYPSETPAEFKPSTVGFDHERREAMIPMRDGVKLHTVILVPKGAQRAPMLLTRTPYDANG